MTLNTQALVKSIVVLTILTGSAGVGVALAESV